MQNKGLVKLFALLFGLVSVFQLSFTFKSNQIESNANEYAISKISDAEIDFDKKRNQVREYAWLKVNEIFSFDAVRKQIENIRY